MLLNRPKRIIPGYLIFNNVYIKKELFIMDEKPKDSIKYEIPDFDSVLNVPEVDDLKSKEKSKIFENLKKKINSYLKPN